jgi:hypothetical protein
VVYRALQHLEEGEFNEIVKGVDRLRAVGIIREDGSIDYSLVLQAIALATRDEYLKQALLKFTVENFREDLRKMLGLSLAHDKLLLKLTSRTTVDFEKLMSPGSITIFSVPKADLGENLARLIASTIVMKLWFEVLARARLNKPRTPVFLVIDEFQFVADLPIIDTILSEARMYGLHLVIAHQHTKQIPEQLLQSVMSNCAVKVAFQVGGGDIKKLSVMDASFADSLEKALTGLTIGKAVVKLTARPGEQQPPPVVVQMDYIKHESRREDVYTTVYDPGEPRSQDLRGLLNPVLKYIEPVKPLEFYTLYTLRVSGSLAIADLATRLGARREDIEEAVNTLAGRGYIEVYREGNKKIRLGGVLLFSLVLDMVLWPWFLLGLPVAFPLCVVLALLILVFLSLVFTSALFKWIILLSPRSFRLGSYGVVSHGLAVVHLGFTCLQGFCNRR